LQGAMSVYGIDSMNLDGVTITAQFRTMSGAQGSITRAFNERLKKLVDNSADVHFAQHYPQGFLIPARDTGQTAQAAQAAAEPPRSALVLPDMPPSSQ